MPIEGDIKDFSLTEVIQIIGQNGKTGTLAVEGERETVWIYFKEGKAVFATPSNSREQLGAIMRREGRITQEDLNLALRTQKKMHAEGNPIRLGMILLAMGSVDRDVLVDKITHQIKESVYSAIGERSGRFLFFPELNLEEEDILVSMDVEQIILEGARRIEEWGQIKDRVKSYDQVFAINPNPAGSGAVKLTPQEWRVLSLLDGRRSIAVISDEVGLGRFEVCRLIYGLLNMNIVRAVGGDADSDEPSLSALRED